MSQRYSWKELFPVEETKIAALFLVTTWNRISQAHLSTIRYAKHEPKLTEELCYWLNSFQGESGLTGFWINEVQEIFLNEEDKLTDRIKKDISYLSNASGKQLDLIFEFKKLSRSSLAAYYGKEGMHRFVDGNYAVNKPLAVMVGILDGREDDIIGALCKSLSKEGVRNKLKMVHDGNDRYILQPSEVFPEVAEFDTEHHRSAEKAPPNGTTTIAHIFLISES